MSISKNNKIVIVYLFLFFSLIHTDLLKAKEDVMEKFDSEVTVYLRSGEIIKGNIVKETDNMLTIEKEGNILSFKNDSILKVINNKTGLALPAKLPFKTAVITYEYKGSQTGKEIIYIDGVKNKAAIESHNIIPFAGRSYPEDKITIYEGDFLYTADLEKKSVLKMRWDGDTVLDIFGEQFYLEETTKISQELFMERECKVYEGKLGKAYFWEGILLKAEIVNPLGEEYNFFKEAVDIKLDVAIPQEKFELPKGVEVKTWEETMKEMGGKSEEWVKQSEQRYKEYLLDLSRDDVEAKRIIEESTRSDGTLDVEKAKKLMEEKETKEFVDKVKAMSGGQELIKEATSEEGEIDYFKLQRIVWEKKLEEEEKRLIDEVKVMEGGEYLIKKAAREDGKVDMDELRHLLWEKQRQEWDKSEAQRIKESEISQKYHELITEGEICENKEKYREALDKYSQAISLNPLNSYGYSNRYRVYINIGEYENAISDLTSLVDIGIKEREGNTDDEPLPLDVEGSLKERADIYHYLGKYQLAIADYTECLKILAEAKEKKSEDEIKKTEEKKTVEEEADNKIIVCVPIEEENGKTNYMDFIFVEVLNERGNTYRKIGKNEEAIKDFTEVVGYNLDNKHCEAEAYFLRGLTYKQMGDLFRMQEDFNKAEALGSYLEEGDRNLASEREGYVRWYYANGDMKTEGNYLKGKEQGLFKWYWPNGTLQSEVNFADGKKEGVAKYYYRGGREISSEGDFIHDKKNGLWKEYFLGSHNIESEIYYKDGKRDGECKWYYENGNLKEVTIYKQDIEEGPSSWYYENGNLKEKTPFKNGKPHGMHYFYYESGELQEEGPYEDGKENGIFILYNKDGSLKKKIVFEKGQRIKEIYN